MSRLLPPTDETLAEAVSALRNGNVVAFPTETVYGLGADTYNVEALRLVYRLKGRPTDNPLIAHVADENQARRVTPVWDERCTRLAARFWPGPLTLVMPRRNDVPDEATAGWPTIAVRCPAHPVALDLLRRFGGPISAPSANRSGHVSPTTAQHVADDFDEAAPDLIILDGGPCDIGIESTVIDLGSGLPAVLRPGAVSIEALRAEIGDVAVSSMATQTHSPGTSGAHYAPRTPVELVAADALPLRLGEIGPRAVVLRRESAGHPGSCPTIIMPDEPDAYAARLYSALREADRLDADRILVEEPPSAEGLWLAVCDRLRRAIGDD